MACKQDADFKFLYPLNLTIKEKIEIIARQVYRADGVEYLPAAVRRRSLLTIFSCCNIRVALTPRMRLQPEGGVACDPFAKLLSFIPPRIFPASPDSPRVGARRPKHRRPPSSCTRSKASLGYPSVWPRHNTPSRTTQPRRARPLDSLFRSGISAQAVVRASCIRLWATCRPFQGFPHARLTT